MTQFDVQPTLLAPLIFQMLEVVTTLNYIVRPKEIYNSMLWLRRNMSEAKQKERGAWSALGAVCPVWQRSRTVQNGAVVQRSVLSRLQTSSNIVAIKKICSNTLARTA